ncbi:MAG: type IV pilus assembly protein PilM [Candidatus Harrisonbacteria bacterium]|nr:type IV pilus assembly protein PilM [Candidatus Harrisonbacteria bacterium]
MAFGFFKKFFPVKSSLGIDIGTASIKLAEIKKDSAQPELLNYGILESYGHLERPNSAIQTSTLKMLDRETAELLKILLKNSGVKSTDAVAALPAFSSFVALLEMPAMSGKDTTQAMQFQAKQYIPLPISEVTIDWLKVGERQDAKGNSVQQILLVSVPNEQIEKYKNIFKWAGLNLTALEVEGLSSSRALTGNNSKTALIMDIGSRSTAISIAQSGLLKFSGQTDFSGGSLTQTLAAGLNIRPRRAEDLKKQRGLRGTGGEYELSTLMLPILDVIINEARRVKENYEKAYNDKVEQVILSGGGANLLGVAPYVQEALALPASKANPFSQLRYPSGIEPFVGELGPQFSVAIGLAMKPFQ